MRPPNPTVPTTFERATLVQQVNAVANPPELYNEPDLIQRFQEDVELAGLIGERKNAAIVFLSAVSAKLRKPLNLTIQGSSAAGKNHLLSCVANFIPEEMKKMITGMSPKVLMHADENEFEHKVIFIAEYEGVSGADYAIRTMQSEQIIEWEFVESSSKGIHKKKSRVKGPAAFIQATTRAVLHPENETRLLFVRMDESDQLTQEILRHQAREAVMGTALTPEGLFKPWQELISSLKVTSVTIPFAPQLVPHFPDSQVRSRRDFPKFLGLIEASAFLHQHQRAKDGREVVADPKDYRVAKGLFEHAYSSGPDKAVSKLLQAAKALQASSGDFRAADLMKETAWHKAWTHEVLSRAEELGGVVPGDRRGHYRYLRDSAPSPLTLPEAVPGCS